LDLGGDLTLRPLGVLGLDERGDARDVGRGEAGAVVEAVAALGDGGDHVDAGCGHVDEVAGLGEGRAFVVAVGGGDREDAFVGGGVGLLDVASGAVVARGGDDDDLPGQGLVDGGLEVRVGFGGVGGVLADVDDLRLGLDGVADALGEGAGVAVAVGVVLLDGDDGRLGGEAHEAGLAGGPGGDDAGDLGAVADGVGGAVLLAAVDGIAVVVLEALGQEVAAALGVDRALELRVAGVDAGVDDGDAHTLALGLGPQRVELDALEGPGAAGIGGV